MLYVHLYIAAACAFTAAYNFKGTWIDATCVFFAVLNIGYLFVPNSDK